jgi:hypothetical protein
MHLRRRLKEGCLTAGGECIWYGIGRNGSHWASSFFSFAVRVEAMGILPGVIGNHGILSVNVVWGLLVVSTSKVGLRS